MSRTPLAEEIHQEGFGLRPLDLYRRDVDLGDAHVVLETDIESAQPPLEVAVGQREPELVLGHAQQHWVVQHSASLVAEDYVLALHHRDALGAARDHGIDEALGVRPLHLDLPFHGHVPKRDVVHQRVVFHHRAAVFRADVATWMVDAVVHRGAPTAGFHRQVPIGRFTHSRGDQHLNLRRPRLAQIDGYSTVRLVNACVLAQIGVAHGGLSHGPNAPNSKN